jgi:flagellin
VQLKALAVHAANDGVVTTEQVAADQQEADNIIATIDRIDAVTRFAGETVFGQANAVFHIGEGGGTNDQASLTIVSVDATALGINGLTIDAATAISDIEGGISIAASIRGTLGAFQKNTLQTNINSLSVTLENVTATESYIRDANMAEETSQYTKNQILVQAGVAMLAQSNVASQSVLQLLG